MNRKDFITKACDKINLNVEVHSNDFSRAFTSIVEKKDLSIAAITTPWKLFTDDTFTEQEIDSLATIFFNNIWPLQDQFKTKSDVIDFIKANFPDKSPNAKADRFLLFVHSLAEYDGHEIRFFDEINSKGKGWRNIFLDHVAEFEFYYTYLIESGFLIAPLYEQGQPYNHYSTDSVALTVKGLERVVTVLEREVSKTCFIAMSFDDEMLKVYNEAIKPAIIETGFEALIINEKGDIPSDTTINDAILAAIKKSKFTIADFTNHKHGVYFESAYALGRGQKVIYTCRQDEIGKAHFDTRNYPHIVWKDAEDLKKQLIDKIEVFIKG